MYEKINFYPEPIKNHIIKTINEAVTIIAKILPTSTIILGGGTSRGEFSYHKENLLSDVDIFVCTNFIPFFFFFLKKILEKRFKKPFIHLRPVIPLFLNQSRTVTAYEIKQHGIVLYGKDIRNRIKVDANTILKFEAIRVFFTRLEYDYRRNIKREPYQIARVYLAMGDSLLIMLNRYKPSYFERMKEIENIDLLPKDLKNKIISGYKVKLSITEPDYAGIYTSEEVFIKDLLIFLRKLLHLYLKIECNVLSGLLEVDRKIKAKPLFNFVYCLLLRRFGIKLYRSLKFKPTKLYLAVLDRVLGGDGSRYLGYFFDKDIIVNNFEKIFDCYPNIAFHEIVYESE